MSKTIFVVSVIYWDIHRWDKEPVSPCHSAEIKLINDRPMCTECKMYCEIVGEGQ